MKKSIDISKSSSLAVNQQEFSLIREVALLTKFKLSSIVVFSSILSYLVVAGVAVDLMILSLLLVGGYCITGSANALNQVLEREYDGLMLRTSNRPLVTGKLNTSKAVLIAGLLGVVGLLCLANINAIVALLGTFSLMLYAFVYTPLKRYTSFSVTVGAIPGALPVLIGAVAFEGTISLIALCLFAVQFFWQFPHFWAIGYKSYNDYKTAGFKLVPTNKSTDQVNKSIGTSSIIYSLLIVAVVIIMFAMNMISIIGFICCAVLSILYAYLSIRFTQNFDDKSATALMLYSFAFMPVFLIICIIS